jgi:hypothetical protein
MNQNITDEVQVHEDPEEIQKVYAKTNFVLREARKELLAKYEVEDEPALLEKIRSGQVEEHPGYDHYLSALILEQTRQHVRADLLAQMGREVDDLPASVHLMLKDRVEAHYADRLDGPVSMMQDALLLSFDNGMSMEVRYYSADEYQVVWIWGEAQLRIDTAPTHPQCPTFPHHLHGDDGGIHADSVTLPGSDCWTNFSRLLDVLLADPLLSAPPASPESGR